MTKIFISDLAKEKEVRAIAYVYNCTVRLVGGDLEVSGSVLGIYKFKKRYKRRNK